jgi:VIT1/CCC1 family predicted Fe2+/Mn2+ transporter
MTAHSEVHKTHRTGWLRAAVLGANDGIVSTASLVLGVSASDIGRSGVLVAGMAGLVGGALSMAAGEYVSVSSQSDTEAADLARERSELADDPQAELAELASLYVARGLDPTLANTVAEQLMQSDGLAAHAREELGISEATVARPVQAAMASAATFAIGAALPLTAAALVGEATRIWVVASTSLGFLFLLGAVGARAGGARALRPALRVTFWGALAMTVTAAIGAVFGTVV